jgi:type IV secretion system protein VirD4
MFKRSAPPSAPAPTGIYYGCYSEDGKTYQPQFFKGDEHFLLIGPTRSGKGRSILAPNLILDTSRSALVVDPKGELAGWTARHRAAAGHEVVYLDPFRELAKDARLATTAGGVTTPAASRGFNPLRCLDPASDAFIDDIMSATEAMVQVSERDPHWGESAQDFVAGVTMHEVAEHGADASYRTIREILSADDLTVGKYCAEACAAPLHPLIPNKLARVMPLADAKAEGNRELASILSTARTQTRFLDSPLIAADLAGDGGTGGAFAFGDMKRKLMTVYLVIPPSYLITHAKWLRLILDAAIRAMQRVPSRESKHDVLFMLDEFAQYGRLNSIETSIALNAGYGIKIFAVVQSLAQLKHLYRENWETIVSGGVIASFGPRDYFTSEYLAKLTGQSLRNKKGTTLSPTGGPSVSVTPEYHYTFMPHELRQMPRGKLLAFVPTRRGGQEMRECVAPDFSALDGKGGVPEVGRLLS